MPERVRSSSLGKKIAIGFGVFVLVCFIFFVAIPEAIYHETGGKIHTDGMNVIIFYQDGTTQSFSSKDMPQFDWFGPPPSESIIINNKAMSKIVCEMTLHLVWKGYLTGIAGKVGYIAVVVYNGHTYNVTRGVKPFNETFQTPQPTGEMTISLPSFSLTAGEIEQALATYGIPSGNIVIKVYGMFKGNAYFKYSPSKAISSNIASVSINAINSPSGEIVTAQVSIKWVTPGDTYGGGAGGNRGWVPHPYDILG